ncbi:MAG: guanylate kinase [Limnothrix sp.]|uniref:guanylate kinase n=1 Tax=unclassified Limnothrix TaxID=2632864 RepID=UPI00081F2E54|nr:MULTISPECIES: guanylate kinase [unclassified Limnothrix]MEB3118688.1 guanylate kinase [Limnothrix sp.]OCQ95214.1 guanylate kinase [Limnothrix sp. P13C2]MBD2161193.1 guanylate kinase [Limnothrix sp. FACHB-1083]MBD2192443.1 guanylate kinase [Limnothrix sp. FACHB-1088]MBD2553318.1 guanylate kinase [Limnothrix sp. FACHB-708]
MANGTLTVLTGPSGVGKGTLVKLLRERHPDLYLSVSATTRSPRDGEVDGQDYFFVSRDRFMAMAEAGDLLEWAEFAGNCYGTPRQPIVERLARGEQVLLEIELEGARQVKTTFPEAFRVFVLPPSLDELERRLRSRGQDAEAAIERRLARAREEVAAADEFDQQVVNDDLDKALIQLESIMFSPIATPVAGES